MKRRCTGFTLIEVLIVVVIMAVLAATIIPQFTRSTTDAKESAVSFNTHSLRAQIELYRIDHNGLYPTLTDGTLKELITQTDYQGNAGTEYGPYIVGEFPKNPFNNSNTVVAGTGAGVVGGGAGWQYNAATGEIWPNHAEYFAE
ncbi:MAG TPA: redox-sensing transcriptional repressor Rex [Planctomycetaceae bacterium]|nr:redox-sensing transcriptional repressor Rex [Planctomycetaceae bacterium]